MSQPCCEVLGRWVMDGCFPWTLLSTGISVVSNGLKCLSRGFMQKKESALASLCWTPESKVGQQLVGNSTVPRVEKALSSPWTSVPGPIHCWLLWSCPGSLGTLGVHQHEDTRDHPTCRARVPVKSPAPVLSCPVAFPDSGISAYATILQLGKLRPEKLNEQTIP